MRERKKVTSLVRRSGSKEKMRNISGTVRVYVVSRKSSINKWSMMIILNEPIIQLCNFFQLSSSIKILKNKSIEKIAEGVLRLVNLSRVVNVTASLSLRGSLHESFLLEKNLEPAPVSFTLPDKGNSKDLHTFRQDHYLLAVLEPAWSVQLAS